MTLLIILSVVFTISLAALVGGVLLLYKKSWARFLSKYLISFAIGSLLGVSFLELLPEAIGLQPAGNVLVYSLIGMIVFYLGEKTLLWYHHHSLDHIVGNGKEHPEEERVHPVGYLIAFGDTFHNFLDGVVIAASFLVDTRLGFLTSLAVLFHELPQEIGDFAIMLHAKFSRTKVIVYNLLSQLAAVVGAFVGVFYLPSFGNLEASIIALAAGGFIYIASTDLLPETHRERRLGKSVIQLVLLILGVLTIWYIGAIFPA